MLVCNCKEWNVLTRKSAEIPRCFDDTSTYRPVLTTKDRQVHYLLSVRDEYTSIRFAKISSSYSWCIYGVHKTSIRECSVLESCHFILDFSDPATKSYRR